ncbi:hypothetical protein F2Q70_00025922 [Brassica cretica]|uniref:Uncharacterized protein n=1 Tax=Brassica cretica TaxID=69181 RepID=A0A8S9LG64_BRACR|nr:hypothetical protein F2Q70_00025922 [Brassica cretica]
MSLGSKSTCSTSLASVSLAGGRGLSVLRFSAADVSLGFCPEERSRDVPGLSSGVAMSSFLPWIFVDPRGRTAWVLAIKAENIFLNSSSVAALAVALAAETSAAGVWRLVSLPPLRGVCMLFVSSVDMSD